MTIEIEKIMVERPPSGSHGVLTTGMCWLTCLWARQLAIQPFPLGNHRSLRGDGVFSGLTLGAHYGLRYDIK